MRRVFSSSSSLAAAGEAARAGEDSGALARLSVFLTLAAWTKPEGLVAALAAAAVLAVVRRGSGRARRLPVRAALRRAPVGVARRPARPRASANRLRACGVLAGEGRDGSRDAGLRGGARGGPRPRGGRSPAPRAGDAPAPAGPPRVGGGHLVRASRIVRVQPARPCVARALVVGPDPRRAGRRPHPGARRGTRGMRDGSKRRAASSGVPAGSWPSALRAKANAARRRAASSVSSGSAPSLLPSFFPSAPRTSGRCAYDGVGSESARWSAICRAVESRRSDAAHDLGDALLGVVDDDRELVCVRPVRALHDEIADGDPEILGYGTEEKILERDEARGDAEAEGAGGATRRKARAAGAGIDRATLSARRFALIASRRGRRGACEIRSRTRAGEDLFPSKKIFRRPVIQREPGGLEDDVAVPREAEALERAEDVVGGARDDARRVEVLHPNEPAPAVRAREEPRTERGDEAPEVQRAGRRGREAPDGRRGRRRGHHARLTR